MKTQYYYYLCRDSKKHGIVKYASQANKCFEKALIYVNKKFTPEQKIYQNFYFRYTDFLYEIVEIYCYYENVPTIRIKNNSNFNPSAINIIIYDFYLFSKSILSLNDDLSLLISGLDPNISDSILSKISFYETFNNPLDNYKIVLTKDKKGFYLVDDDFDESKTPDSVLIGDDEEDIVYDDIKYEINDPPPKVYLDKDNKKNKLSTGAIIGIVVGCVVAVALIVILIVFLVIRRKKENNQTISENEGKDNINDDSTGL